MGTEGIQTQTERARTLTRGNWKRSWETRSKMFRVKCINYQLPEERWRRSSQEEHIGGK